MIKGLLYFLWYSIKYEIKRSYIFMGIIILLYLLFSGGFKQQVSAGVNSVNIIDEDNSELSRNFTSYIKSNNITINPESFNTLFIPKGFEEDYNRRNATLKVGFSGVDSNKIYEYQLYRLGDSNRITAETIVIEQKITIFIIGLLFISAIVAFFYESRISGKLYFITNHISFWTYFALSHIIFILLSLYIILSGGIPLKILLLLLIVYLIFTILIFYNRNNTKLSHNINYIIYAVGALLVVGRIIGLKKYPLVGLLFDGYSPVIFTDITIFIILLIIVSRIKLTE